MRVLLFGGTSEGVLLARALADRPVQVVACVATGYGRDLLPEGFPVRTGRMDRAEIAALMRAGCDLAIDATHPYAAEITANLRAAAAETGVPLWRCARPASVLEGCAVVEDAAGAARRLAESPVRALLVTGAKELDVFTRVPDFASRLYVRVLPAVASLERCLALGYRPDHILAMQGPFSAAFNLALMREWEIRCLVTKDGGDAGGFAEKARAAAEAGVEVLVIRRPAPETGLAPEEILARLDMILAGGSLL